jgi:hypothetical protein
MINVEKYLLGGMLDMLDRLDKLDKLDAGYWRWSP